MWSVLHLFVVGSDSSALAIESAAVFLIDTLKESSQIGKKESAKLKENLGAFPASAASKSCHIIHNIVTLLPEESVLYLIKSLSQPNAGQKLEKEFGAGVKFFAMRNNVAVEPSEDSLVSESDSENESDGLDTFPCEQWKYDPAESASCDSTSDHKVDSLWLRTQFEQLLGDSPGDLSALDLCSAVFDILSSARDDAEIQNELFDLLGFDRFEFIQSLLTNRRKVVEATFESASGFGLKRGECRGHAYANTSIFCN